MQDLNYTFGRQSNKTMSSFDWLQLVILSILWGGSFFFVGISNEELPPLTIVLLRVGLAAIALNVIILVLGFHMPTNRQIWIAFFGMGFLNNFLPFSLIVWGQTYIASGLASILNATTPLFSVIITHFLTRDEKMNAPRIIGVIVGFIGVVIIIGPSVLGGIGTNVLAQMAILSATVSYAFAGVWGRRFERMGVTPILAATGQVTASTILLIPVAFLVEQPWSIPMPELKIIIAIMSLGFFSTALAFVLYFRILATAGPTNLLLVTFLIPISAVILGVTFLSEQIGYQQLIGMALIGLGLATLDGRPIDYFHRRAKLMIG